MFQETTPASSDAAKIHSETIRKLNEDACNYETASDCANAVNKQIKFKIGGPLPCYEPSPDSESKSFMQTHDEMIEVIQHHKNGGKVAWSYHSRNKWHLFDPKARAFDFAACKYRVLQSNQYTSDELSMQLKIEPISGKDGFCSMTLATKGNQYATQIEIIAKRLNELIESHNKIISIIQKQTL